MICKIAAKPLKTFCLALSVDGFVLMFFSKTPPISNKKINLSFFVQSLFPISRLSGKKHIRRNNINQSKYFSFTNTMIYTRSTSDLHNIQWIRLPLRVNFNTIISTQIMNFNIITRKSFLYWCNLHMNKCYFIYLIISYFFVQLSVRNTYYFPLNNIYIYIYGWKQKWHDSDNRWLEFLPLHPLGHEG